MPVSFRSVLDRRLRFTGSLSLGLQLLLLLVVFGKLIFNPGDYLIVTHFDGIKSYFSIEAFLRQPLNTGMVVQGHNYPFGEYMYYTDSTPLLTELVHVLVRAVPALQPYGLYIYDLAIIGGLLLATGLLHLLLRPWQLPAWLHVLAAVALPWLSPQTYRLRVGHMSLAYAPAVLLTLWLLQELYLRHAAGKPLRRWYVGLGLSILAASYWHFYYLAILGALAGFFLVAWVVELYLHGRDWARVLRDMALTLGGAALVTAGSLLLLDGRFKERPTSSTGYGYDEWKLHFSAFFQAHEWNKVRFIFEPVQPVPYESTAYLTAFVLYALVVAAVLKLARRLPAFELRRTPQGRFLLLLLLATTPLLFIALGEVYALDGGTYQVHNYANAFFWLRKITDRVTQFRALGRFIWPFWWAVTLLVLWLVATWRTSSRWQPVRWLAVLLPLLLLPDLYFNLRFYRESTQFPNFLSGPPEMQPLRALTGWAGNLRDYQAILPIPYYHVGSEGDWSYTVDPDDPHCNRTYELACITNLPLMSHKAVRTPPYQAQQLYSIFRPEGPDPALLARMDNRPVLVYLDSAYYTGANNYYRDGLKDRPGMLETFERGDDFVREHHLKLLAKSGTLSLYAWYPKGQPVTP